MSSDRREFLRQATVVAEHFLDFASLFRLCVSDLAVTQRSNPPIRHLPGEVT